MSRNIEDKMSDSLTEEIQKEYINDNFNKMVICSSQIGRLIGYAETKQNFLNVIAFGYGHKETLVYMDAGLRLTFLENDNIVFKETNELLVLNGNPELEKPMYFDFRNDVLFNSRGIEYIKQNALCFFNKIVQIDKDIVRLIGYAEDDYSHSYICLNINNEKKYFDATFRVKDVDLSVELKSYFDEKIERNKEIVIEDLRVLEDNCPFK